MHNNNNDAVAAKMQQYDTPHIINAQPVTQNPTYSVVGTVAAPPTYVANAAPYGSQPVYVQSNGMPINTSNGQPVAGRQRVTGRWTDNICDWPSNLYPSCYCICCVCCGMWLVAQSKCHKTYYYYTFSLLFLFYIFLLSLAS